MVKEGKRNFNTTLDEEIYKRLKVVSAMSDRDMGIIVEDLLRASLPDLEKEASKLMLFPPKEPENNTAQKKGKKGG